MKKAIITILALTLVLSLAACGGNSNTGNDDPLTRPGGATSTPSATPSTPAPSGNTEQPGNNTPDLAGLIGGTGKLSDYNATERQQMIDEARADGGDLEFRADGSAVYTDPNGDVLIQNPDGTWTYQDEDGSIGQYGGDWPENEFTKLLPKPEFALTAAHTDDNVFNVMFADATIEQIKDYAEQLKSEGFTENATTEDTEAMGMVLFNYEAENADGYKVNVFSAAGTAGLSIEKP